MSLEAIDEVGKQLEPKHFGQREKRILLAIFFLVIANLVVSLLLIAGGLF